MLELEKNMYKIERKCDGSTSRILTSCHSNHLDSCLLNSIAVATDARRAGGRDGAVGRGRCRHAVEIAFDFGDAKVSGQQSLAVKTLQNGADARPVDDLKDEQVRLRCKNQTANYKPRKNGQLFFQVQLTQQQADTVIWMVLRPTWQTSLR